MIVLRRAAITAGLALGACQDGSVQVVLVQPAVDSARPAQASTAVLRLLPEDGDELFRTGTTQNTVIDFGEIPVDRYRRASVELRDVSNGLVGFGRTVDSIEVTADGDTRITIPIRRPRILAVGPAASRAANPDDTVAPLETPSSTTVQLDVSGGAEPVIPRTAPGATRITATAGADQFIAVGGAIHRLDTYTDAFIDAPFVDVGAPVLDLAGSADGRWLAVGTAGGMHIVEVAAPAPALYLSGRRVDAVAFSVDADGQAVAIALVDAARSAVQCPKPSRVVVVRPGEPETAGRDIDPGGGVADVAGSSTRPRVVAAGVCGNRSLLIGLDPDRIIATETNVTAPTVAASLDDRAWIAGVRPGVVQPVPGSPSENWTAVGAIPEILTFDLMNDGASRFDLPQLSEAMFTRDDGINSISQTTNAKNAAVQGLAVSPTGDQLVMAVTELYNHPPLVINVPLFGDVDVFPQIVLHASRLLVVSTQTTRIEQVIRTRCKVCMLPASEMGNGCGAATDYLYADWACVTPPGLLEPVSEFELGGVAAIFGAP